MLLRNQDPTQNSLLRQRSQIGSTVVPPHTEFSQHTHAHVLVNVVILNRGYSQQVKVESRSRTIVEKVHQRTFMYKNNLLPDFLGWNILGCSSCFVFFVFFLSWGGGGGEVGEGDRDGEESGVFF